MHILIAHHTRIPVTKYGGTERIMWWLGKELQRLGHQVSFLVNSQSNCPFAEIVPIKKRIPLNDQVPEGVDLVHFFFQPREEVEKPYLVTNQGNVPDDEKHLPLDQNTVFVSKNHAKRHGAERFVYNGLDTSDCGPPDLNRERSYFHFLAKASWKLKNLQGAIEIAERAEKRLEILGGSRINHKTGLKYFDKRDLKFHGMVGGERKNRILNGSKGLIFPVLWNEPFGIAMIESLYFGCPVFGTTFGSLPEIINEDVGYLSNDVSDLVSAIKTSHYDKKMCHDYVHSQFTAENMTMNYLKLYEKVLSGERLNYQAPSAGNTFNEKCEMIDSTND
ncbi:MAG: glycosyltransferase [Cyclobacteriaceae bacterium]